MDGYEWQDAEDREIARSRKSPFKYTHIGYVNDTNAQIIEPTFDIGFFRGSKLPSWATVRDGHIYPEFLDGESYRESERTTVKIPALNPGPSWWRDTANDTDLG